MNEPAIHCVLFDLDGTLVDTAPDLGNTLNQLMLEEGREPLPQSALRPFASSGARGLLSVGFDMDEKHPDYADLRERFLQIYAENSTLNSTPFPGITNLLHILAERGIHWGVVTNKPGWLTNPLMEKLAFAIAPACVIGGDATPYPKPDPGNLLLACEQIGLEPEHCLYVGDAQRDITAGQRAGMRTVAVRYGYIETGDCADNWGADWMIDHPAQLIDCL